MSGSHSFPACHFRSAVWRWQGALSTEEIADGAVSNCNDAPANTIDTRPLKAAAPSKAAAPVPSNGAGRPSIAVFDEGR